MPRQLTQVSLNSKVPLSLCSLCLLVTIIVEGWDRLDLRLITEYPASSAERAGARTAILGSAWVIGTTAALSIPLGVAAAIHLEEFADKKRWFNRLIELNLQNLAAVPSIVYGLLALAFLSLLGVQNKNIVIGGALALSLLILPVIIIATRESLRAVPLEIRQGSLALGASPWQTVWRNTLPAAVPGIATGSILGLSRALGEAAPLLLLGALVFVSFDPNGLLRLHDDADPDLQLDRSAPGGVPRARGGSQRAPGRPPARDERPRHLRSQSIPETVVTHMADAPNRNADAPMHLHPDRHGGFLSNQPRAVMECDDVAVFYGSFRAVSSVNLKFGLNEITALIGPSGCGKSTILRSLNRMNDLVDGARVEGRVMFQGEDIYAKGVDAIEVRRRIGMVFQKPNPFPKPIYDNIAYGPRVTGMRLSSMDDLVEEALTKAALWDEVKDKLKQSAFGLSGGQQQRLCIARTIAVRPDIILMDEPCSSLDPIATMRIEDLMQDLRRDYTIVIVTHNMQQAARVADRTAFFTALPDEGSGDRTGVLVEHGTTEQIFENPADKRTEDYISGRFG